MSVKAGRLSDIADTQPERLIKYRVSEDGFEAEVLLPGLWYTDFDKKIGGKMSYWSILKLLESMRWVALAHGFAYYPDMCHGTNKTVFIASASYHLSANLHNVQYKTHFGVKFPLRVKLSVPQLGNTSFLILTEVYDVNDTLMMKHLIKPVLVDRQTRKPTPLPGHVQEKFKKVCSPSPQYLNLSRAKAPVVPSKSFELARTILHSDCDMNGHATQIIFFKWCSDAAAEAAKAGYLPYFTKHPELFPLRFCEMHFVGEVVANEEVVVRVWEDETKPRCLRATVSAGGRLIYHTVMEYHEGPPVPVEPHLESKL